MKRSSSASIVSSKSQAWLSFKWPARDNSMRAMLRRSICMRKRLRSEAVGFMVGGLDDEPSGDFGIGHVGDHRLKVGAGLGLLDGLGTVEAGNVLEASDKALLGGRF